MILIMSEKQWAKSKKKLVEPKDYLIIDGTNDDDAKLNAYTNVITMDGFNPPVKLIKAVHSEKSLFDDDILDYSKIEKLEKNYFNGSEFVKASMAAVAGLLENEDINIFIVLRNKAFKYYGKTIKKKIQKMFDVDFKFIDTFSGDIHDHKKDLRRTFDSYDLKDLREALKIKEKEMTKRFDKKSMKRKRRF